MQKHPSLASLFAISLSTLLLGVESRAQGSALLFDGVDDWAGIPDTNNDFDFGSAMTVEAWVRVDGADVFETVVGGHIGPIGIAWGLEPRSTPDTAAFLVSTPLTSSVGSASMWPADGVWRHYAATFDGTNMELFVNGASVAQGVHGNPGSVTPVDAVHLGRRTLATRYFEGALDEVRLWNVVRTPVEIAQSYNVCLVGDEPGLVGYYQFDEPGGQAIVDTSLAGNDGTLGANANPFGDDPTRIPSGALVSCGPLFAESCNGDGGDQMGCTNCPCGNNAVPGTIGGCVNSAGTSARLIGTGTSMATGSNATPPLRFECSGVAPLNSAQLTSGNALAPANAANPCFGLNSGIQSVSLDGLRCAVQNVLRHGVRPSDANGDVGVTTNGWGGSNNFFNYDMFTVGQTKVFQVIHRDDVAAVCATGQNTSQALSVTFTP